VVDVAPGRGTVTSGEHTASIALEHRQADGAGEEALFVAEIERDPCGVEHDR